MKYLVCVSFPLDAFPVCMRVCAHMPANAVQSCCLLLLMSVRDLCTLGVRDNSLLPA